MAYPEKLLEIVTKATHDFLGEYSIVFQEISEVSIPDAQIATLRFEGDGFVGGLTVSASKEFLAKSHPNVAMEMPVDDEAIVDWCGEIANQIVGNLKRTLSEFKVTFKLSTPEEGAANEVVDKEGELIAVNHVQGDQLLGVHFRAIVNAKHEFTANKDVTFAEAGAAILF